MDYQELEDKLTEVKIMAIRPINRRDNNVNCNISLGRG